MSVEVRLPDLGEGIEAVDVLTVLVTVGQVVAADDSLIEIESEKATLDVPADSGGTVTAIHVKAGDTIAVGQPLLTLDPIAAGPPPAPADVQAPVHDVPSTDRAQVAEGPAPQPAMADSETRADANAGDGPPVAAAPSVRTFAREIGVDVRQVEGSGRRDGYPSMTSRRMLAAAARWLRWTWRFRCRTLRNGVRSSASA